MTVFRLRAMYLHVIGLNVNVCFATKCINWKKYTVFYLIEEEELKRERRRTKVTKFVTMSCTEKRLLLYFFKGVLGCR